MEPPCSPFFAKDLPNDFRLASLSAPARNPTLAQAFTFRHPSLRAGSDGLLEVDQLLAGNDHKWRQIHSGQRSR